MVGSQTARQVRRMSEVRRNPSWGVVTATGLIVWPTCIGAMNWFMMTLTSASFQVGIVVAPKIKAVLSGGGTSADDADANGATGAIPINTATPIETVVRVMANPCVTHSRSPVHMSERHPLRRSRSPRSESSPTFGTTNSVAPYCNLAHFRRGKCRVSRRIERSRRLSGEAADRDYWDRHRAPATSLARRSTYPQRWARVYAAHLTSHAEYAGSIPVIGSTMTSDNAVRSVRLTAGVNNAVLRW